MLHVSTRGEAPAIGFADALLAGLARDGGLYVPQRWPVLEADDDAVARGRYADVRESRDGRLVDGEIPGPISAA